MRLSLFLPLQRHPKQNLKRKIINSFILRLRQIIRAVANECAYSERKQTFNDQQISNHQPRFKIAFFHCFYIYADVGFGRAKCPKTNTLAKDNAWRKLLVLRHPSKIMVDEKRCISIRKKLIGAHSAELIRSVKSNDSITRSLIEQ